MGGAALAATGATGWAFGVRGRTVESAEASEVEIGDRGLPAISGTPTLSEKGTSRA
jgi:hypothetical protein